MADHNRASAFLARQAASAAQADATEAGQRVLSMADARLRVVAQELPGLLQGHRDAVADHMRLLWSLDALSDPDAVTAEVTAIKAKRPEVVRRAEADAATHTHTRAPPSTGRGGAGPHRCGGRADGARRSRGGQRPSRQG